MRTQLCLDFSFFAVAALFFMMDKSGAGLCALSACIVHELSHLIVMAAFGIRPDGITFYGAGIRISCGSLENAPVYQRAAVYAAGVAANFIMSAIFFLCGVPLGAYINLFTGAFNLLPLGELDGARLLKMAVMHRCRAENIDTVMRAAGIVSAGICAAAALLLRNGVSFTLITTAVYFIILGARRV